MAYFEALTIEEVARSLKVSKLTVYDLIKKGELQAFRVGRQMRVDATELGNYIARGREVKPVQEKAHAQNEVEARQVVISGQDDSLNILARHLETGEYRPLRAYTGSLDSLIAMYMGNADIVSTHLLDGDTMQYNLPYIRKLLVSQSLQVIHLIKRQAGLYVKKGNPKRIESWQDLTKPGVKLINREKGSGARTLLDEQLRINKIAKHQVDGYTDIQTSHLGVASVIAQGRADVGVGIEQPAKAADIDFIPMITESYDLVMLQTEASQPLIEQVLSVLQSDAFKEELQSLGYDVGRTGELVYAQ